MGISIWQLLIVLLIVVLLFGTKRLRSIGTDLGGAIKGFRESLSGEGSKEEAPGQPAKPLAQSETERVINAEAKHESEKPKG